jgi:hypothetical protein
VVAAAAAAAVAVVGKIFDHLANLAGVGECLKSFEIFYYFFITRNFSCIFSNFKTLKFSKKI